MAAGEEPVSERSRRVGSRALLVLADPVNVSILRGLAKRTRSAAELLGSLEGVSRGTFYNRLRDLEELSLIVRERRPTVPPAADCRLTDAGRRLLSVGDRLQAWLERFESGRVELGDALATNAIKALAAGWESMLIPLLAQQPRSLAELEPFVRGLGYRKLERTALVLASAGLVERQGTEGRMNQYALTPWACDAVIPLVVAIQWELRHVPECSLEITLDEAEGLRALADHCDLDAGEALSEGFAL